MEIDAQIVIDKLTQNFASQNALAQKDSAILESQVELLQKKNAQLELENANLSAELDSIRSKETVEGEVIG